MWSKVPSTMSNGSIPEGSQALPPIRAITKGWKKSTSIRRMDGRFAAVVQIGAQKKMFLLLAEADGIAFEAQVLYDHETGRCSGQQPRCNHPLIWSRLKDGEAFEIGDIQFQTNSSSKINRTSLLMLELVFGLPPPQRSHWRSRHRSHR